MGDWDWDWRFYLISWERGLSWGLEGVFVGVGGWVFLLLILDVWMIVMGSWVKGFFTFRFCVYLFIVCIIYSFVDRTY